MRRRFLVFIAAAFCAPVAVFAVPPDVKYLYPAGAQSGRETLVRDGGTFAAWPVRTWISGTGVRLEPQKESGKFTVHVDADVPPGIRWVRFISNDGATVSKAFVVGAITESTEKEPNEVRAKAQKFDGKPIVVNGALGAQGDVDLYGISLKTGHTLVAACDANAAFGSLIDCALQLIDADGHVLTQNNDERGIDPRIVFSVPRDGVYYVRVFGLPVVPNSSIRFAGAEDAVYRLTLTTAAFVDHAWPVVAPLDATTNVTLQGWNLDPSETPTPMTLSRATPPFRQTVPFVGAGRAVLLGTDVSTIVEADATTPEENPLKITAPVTVNARIERPGDRDEYVISAKKGQSFRLRVVSQAYGFPTDPLVKIYKPDGIPPLRLDDASRTDADVDGLVQATLDGDYRITVEDLFGNGGANYVYVFDLRPTTTEFGLSVAAGEINAVVGKPFELAVTVDRPAGNVNDIEVRIEGLPEKFGAAPAISAGKAPDSKVTAKKATIKFTPTEKFSGPVRIVGVQKGDVEVRRAATAAVVAVPNGRTTDLWLHVGAELPPAAKPAATKKP